MTRMPRRMERRWPLALAMALACLAGCDRAPSAQRPPEPGDKAVAKVNGQVIWASDVKREAIAEGLIGAGDPLDTTTDQFRQVLDEVIDTKVLAGEALRRHLDKDPAAQRRLAAAREKALENLLVESEVGKAVNPGAENSLYQEFLDNRTPTEEIHLHQIVTATQADAEQVRKLIAGGAAFEAVAMDRSKDDATRYKGGDLGPMTTDTLPQGLAAVVKDAKAGQIVGPVLVNGAWTVLRVDDRSPEPPPAFETVRPQIVRFITFDQVKTLVLKLRSKAKIETLIPPEPDLPGAPPEPASAPPGQAPPAAPASPVPANTAPVSETPE